MYLKQKNNGFISLIMWDWKETPDFNALIEAIEKVQSVGKKVSIKEVNTWSDDLACIVCDDDTSTAEAQNMYNNLDDFFEWD